MVHRLKTQDSFRFQSIKSKQRPGKNFMYVFPSFRKLWHWHAVYVMMVWLAIKTVVDPSTEGKKKEYRIRKTQVISRLKGSRYDVDKLECYFQFGERVLRGWHVRLDEWSKIRSVRPKRQSDISRRSGRNGIGSRRRFSSVRWPEIGVFSLFLFTYYS